MLCVDNLETGSLTNIEHLRDERFVFMQHDLVKHLEISEPVGLAWKKAMSARISPSNRVFWTSAMTCCTGLPAGLTTAA